MPPSFQVLFFRSLCPFFFSLSLVLLTFFRTTFITFLSPFLIFSGTEEKRWRGEAKNEADLEVETTLVVRNAAQSKRTSILLAPRLALSSSSSPDTSDPEGESIAATPFVLGIPPVQGANI